MRKPVGILCLLTFTAAGLLSQQSGISRLAGPYLGQKPPGMTPEIFAPGVVSREGDQGELNVSPDMNEIIYWERKPPDNLNTIVRIIRDGEQWKAPEILPFSKDYINNEPSLSPDGKYIFFSRDGDIYWISSSIIEELRPKHRAPVAPESASTALAAERWPARSIRGRDR
jgi:hypothetical protein